MLKQYGCYTLLAAALLLSGCSGQDAAPVTGLPKAGLVIQTTEAAAKSHRFEERLRVEGVVTRTAVQPVVAQTAGVIEAVAVAAGDEVVAGDLLVVLDARDAQEQVRMRAAELSGLNAQWQDQEKVVRDLRALHVKGYISTRELDAARTAAHSMKGQLNAARARLETAERALENTKIHAQVAGRVLTVPAKVGGYAKAGEILLEVLPPAVTAEVSVQIPEAYLADVVPGLPVLLQAGQTRVEAPISRVQPAVSAGARMFDAFVEVPMLSASPGQSVSAWVVLNAADWVAVPESALVLEGESAVVYVLREGKAHRVEVTRKATQDGLVGVEGLPAEQRVAVSGATFLREGAAVEVVQ